MADLVRLTEVIEPEAKALGFDLVRVKMMLRKSMRPPTARLISIM